MATHNYIDKYNNIKEVHIGRGGVGGPRIYVIYIDNIIANKALNSNVKFQFETLHGAKEQVKYLRKKCRINSKRISIKFFDMDL